MDTPCEMDIPCEMETVLRECGQDRKQVLSSGYYSGIVETDICKEIDYAFYIRRGYRFLLHQIFPNILSDKLCANNLISEREKEELLSLKIKHKQNDLIIKCVLQKCVENRMAGKTFIDILEDTLRKGIADELFAEVQDRPSKDLSNLPESFTNITSDDIESCKEFIVDEVDAFKVADVLYENGDLSESDHDEIIHGKYRSYRAKKLVEIVLKKGNHLEFLKALQAVKHKTLLKKIGDFTQTAYKQAAPTSQNETFELMEVDDVVIVPGHKSAEEEPFQCGANIQDIEMTILCSVEDERISDQIVSNLGDRKNEEAQELRRFCTGKLNCSLESVHPGCVIIILSPLAEGAFQNFFQKDNMVDLLNILFAPQNMRSRLPKGKFYVQVKCRSEKTERTSSKSVGSLQEKDRGIKRTFRSLAPYLAERYPPDWILDKIMQLKGFPKHYLENMRSSPQPERRQRETLNILRELYNLGSVSLESVITFFTDLLGKDFMDSIVELCPSCTKHEILQNYSDLLMEIDTGMMQLFYDTCSVFDEDREWVQNVSVGNRKRKAQNVLEYALKSDDRIIDLRNVLTIYGLEALISKFNCKMLNKECIFSKTSTAVTSPRETYQFSRTFLFMPKDSAQGDLMCETTNPEVAEQHGALSPGYKIKVFMEGETSECLMRKVPTRGRSVEKRTTEKNAEVKETEVKDANDEENKEKRPKEEEESGYYSKSSREMITKS